ncbi:MAG TPA: hypothetical protein GX708_09180 [Gallicola sp.]|nr:hypothetical protein [Gallicola sp.]
MAHIWGGGTSVGETEPWCPPGTSYHSGAEDWSDDCEVSEANTCSIGFTVPDWVPYIGGLSCSVVNFTYTLTFPGTKNECHYTGNPSQYCCAFYCRKNN